MRRIVWWIGDNLIGVFILIAALFFMALLIMEIQYANAPCEELINYRAIGDMPGRCLYLIQGGK